MLRRCLVPAFCLICLPVLSQFNYDEAKVPKYTLPDALKMESGDAVTTAKDWVEKRRPEILDLFATHVYGKSPGRPASLRFELLRYSDSVLDGKARRKEVRVHFADRPGAHMDLLIHLPKVAKRKVPIFVAYNFQGNHTTLKDPSVSLSTRWVRSRAKGVVNNKATEESRGAAASRWPYERIVARGYGVATIYYADVDPDFDDQFQNGIHPLFRDEGAKPAGDDWGSIAAWAWGLSRALDYFETDLDIDEERTFVMGHSRLGKTSLWAGATDERFAMVISNNSGCGGAALNRRHFGETVQRINTSFPHWFCDNFTKYNEREAELPVDQHQLIALMAPRPVYVASAVKDRWADPRGEFLSAAGAQKVYELLGKQGLPSLEFPEVDKPLMGTIGYHIRSGGHDVKNYDWDRYMDFADRHFR